MVENSCGNFNNPFISKANYFPFLLGTSPPHLTPSHELGGWLESYNERGGRHVRFHCVCVTADQSDETGISITLITINKCDFMTTLELSSFIKKERKKCKGGCTILIEKICLLPEISS